VSMLPNSPGATTKAVSSAVSPTRNAGLLNNDVNRCRMAGRSKYINPSCKSANPGLKMTPVVQYAAEREVTIDRLRGYVPVVDE
jgi:hypothetical protein